MAGCFFRKSSIAYESTCLQLAPCLQSDIALSKSLSQSLSILKPSGNYWKETTLKSHWSCLLKLCVFWLRKLHTPAFFVFHHTLGRRREEMREFMRGSVFACSWDPCVSFFFSPSSQFQRTKLPDIWHRTSDSSVRLWHSVVSIVTQHFSIAFSRMACQRLKC